MGSSKVILTARPKVVVLVFMVIVVEVVVVK